MNNISKEKVFTRKDVYKIVSIELAKQHKETCNNHECNVSLYILREMAEKLGVEFSKEENEVFL